MVRAMFSGAGYLPFRAAIAITERQYAGQAGGDRCIGIIVK